MPLAAPRNETIFRAAILARACHLHSAGAPSTREPQVLVIHHHRLRRWLLPGGHPEKTDKSLESAAAREAQEKPALPSDKRHAPFLAGIDVHGIPPRAHEPYHLHHDLIWCFRAANEKFEVTEEAPEVMWAQESDWESLDLTPGIRQSIRRANR